MKHILPNVDKSILLFGELRFKFLNQVFHYILAVLRVCGAHLRVIAPGQHSSCRRNVAAVASRWQHRVQFNWPKIWSSNLPLQKRMRYCSTNWPVSVSSSNFCLPCCQVQHFKTLLPKNTSNQIKSFIVLARLRRSV